MTVKTILGIFVLVGCLAAMPAFAADQRLPAKVQVAILFKTLTYDLNLKTRNSDGLRIGVVGLQGDDGSMTAAKDVTSEIQANSDKKVKGLPIVVELITVASADELKKASEEKKLNIIYLGPSLGGMLSPLVEYAKAKKVLLLTGEADYLKAGAAIGAVMRDQKPKILVQLKAAGDQGANLDPRLLRLVEVVQ